jgi:hypothetical protein
MLGERFERVTGKSMQEMRKEFLVANGWARLYERSGLIRELAVDDWRLLQEKEGVDDNPRDEQRPPA